MTLARACAILWRDEKPKQKTKAMKTLPAIHTSPETAYVIEDYPFGFRLRCKKRTWVEFKKNKGYRVVSQTTDPRQATEFWNAPKAGTYLPTCAALYLDEEGHLQNAGIYFAYPSEVEKQKAFRDKFAGGIYGEEVLNQLISKYSV